MSHLSRHVAPDSPSSRYLSDPGRWDGVLSVYEAVVARTRPREKPVLSLQFARHEATE